MNTRWMQWGEYMLRWSESIGSEELDISQFLPTRLAMTQADIIEADPWALKRFKKGFVGAAEASLLYGRGPINVS